MYAGQYSKKIAVQNLQKVKDEYGAEVETWVTIASVRASVQGYDRDSMFQAANEVIVSERLLFTVQKHVMRLIKQEPINYRILYSSDAKCCNKKKYRVLNINDNFKDSINILTEWVNE